MHVTASNLAISPPAAGELCDYCGVAKALVTVMVSSSDVSPSLMVFCGHHFDAIQKGRKPFKTFYDTREDRPAKS